MRRGPTSYTPLERPDRSSSYNNQGSYSSRDGGRYDDGGDRDVKRRKEFERDSSSRYSSSSSSYGRDDGRRSYPEPQHNAPTAQLAKRVLPNEATALGNSDAFSLPSMPVLDHETYTKRIDADLAAKKEAESEEEIIERRRKRLRELMEKDEALKRQQAITVPPAVAQATSTSSSNNTTKPAVVATATKAAAQVQAPTKTSAAVSLIMKEVDSDDDMFGDSFVDHVKEEAKRGVSNGEAKNASGDLGLIPMTGSTQATDATCDDDEGYYNFRVGELLGGGKYEVLGYYGKGVYSNVIKARKVKKMDSKSVVGDKSVKVGEGSGQSGEEKEGQVVAIKLLRNNAHMKRSGRKEVKVLKKLEEADVGGKGQCLRLEEVFEEKRHLCLVFPAYDLNLTQVIKLYGHHVGINIKVVRSYAWKMMKALHLMKRTSIIHADIKPDNILVSDDRAEVVMADFGTAMEVQEVELTNQMVSRYYRAPEIILGFTFPGAVSYPLDMWSIGCCLYEMATGKYLMPSKSENEHVRLSFEIGGPFSKRLLSSAHPPYLAQHFTEGNGSSSSSSSSGSSSEYLFLEHYPDPAGNGSMLVRKVPMPMKATRLILPELLESFSSSPLTPSELAWVHRLADLITQCLILDPKKRITPEEALQHSFF